MCLAKYYDQYCVFLLFLNYGLKNFRSPISAHSNTIYFILSSVNLPHKSFCHTFQRNETAVQYDSSKIVCFIRSWELRGCYVRSAGQLHRYHSTWLCSTGLPLQRTARVQYDYIVLDGGEHRLSSGRLCNVSNEGNIAITGSWMKNTTVRCEGKGRGITFSPAQQLTMERITFINCGIYLVLMENIFITKCTFQKSSNKAIISESSINTYITSCVFQNNIGGAVIHRAAGDVSITDCTFQSNSGTTYGGGAVVYGSTGNVSITNCIFQSNMAAHGGGVALRGSRGNISITNCTFQNNSDTNGGGIYVVSGGSGGIILSNSTGDVIITNCTFQNNSASSGIGGGGGILLYESMGNVSITNCTFQNNSATYGGGGVLLYGSIGDFSISNCTFQNNSATYGGGGVLLYGSIGDFSISSCTFQNNSATYGGGGVLLYGQTGNVSIKNCTFQDNSATNGGSDCGGGVFLYGLIGYVYIINCTFQNHIATYGGAVCWAGVLGSIQTNILDYDTVLQESKSNVSITNCTFQNNSATTGGGAVMSWVGVLSNIQKNGVHTVLNGSAVDVSITNCTFQNNSAFIGGATFITSIRSILINGSTFTKNKALRGAAVFATNSYIPTVFFFASFLTSDTEQLGHLILQDVVIEDNHCSCNDYNETRGGAIYFNGMMVDIFGNTITGSQFSSNSPLGAIQGTNGFLQLHGNIRFTNNTGENGGAINLSNNVPLYFYENCAVEFSKNVATGFGGAIYNNGDQDELMQPMSNLNKCIIRLIKDCNSSNDCVFNNNMFSITFTDNHAQQGGNDVYATPIYNCINCIGVLSTGNLITDSNKYQILTSYFTLNPSPEDINEVLVLSFPKYVLHCGCSYSKLCNDTSQCQGKVTTYPGRTVRLNVTSVDDGKNLSPSVVYTQIDSNGIASQRITLGPRQKAQWIGTVCGTIEYQIYGPEMASLKLLLSNYPTNFPTVLEVKLLPCEPGFTLTLNSSTGMMKCDCSLFFTSHGVVCDASDGTVIRDKSNWIGVYNDTLPALASICPSDYCNSAIHNLSLAKSSLCNGGRTGIICGHCHGNLSVIFGSSKCQVCTDMWLITLVMFAVLGVLLVVALFLLNLTVTLGTLYGLIFYANMIQVNCSIFFSQSILRPLQVIVSLVNLDLGIPLCFYDGMDDADKAGLQFVFPAYLLILTMTVIVLCHCCLQRSPTTSTSSCCYRFPIIIGERAVGVLSTLIYLSYSKLLRTVIDVFPYSTVHLPTGDMYVWFYDGNVEYLHGKHSVLFPVAALTCTLFLLPYTLAITFIPIIERCNRLFNYLHKKANQIKPMNDAHYAPYKGEWQWWLGARLWLLVVMYSLNPVYSSDKPSLLLSIQATMVMLFMLVQAKIEPFGQLLQRPDKCSRHTKFYNQFYNCLDLFYLLNYTALALSMSYILDLSSDQTQITVISVGVLVGLYVVVLMVTVLYHLIVVIFKACKMYDRARERINGLFERKYDVMVPIELDDPATNAASTTTVTVSYGLREPLCED